jgi:hypothetical protein
MKFCNGEGYEIYLKGEKVTDVSHEGIYDINFFPKDG